MAQASKINRFKELFGKEFRQRILATSSERIEKKKLKRYSKRQEFERAKVK